MPSEPLLPPDLAVEVHGVSKTYRPLITDIAGDTLRDGLAALFRRRQPKAHISALADISFRVKPGERVAILGGNGAGKSTLLKLLSRVTTPTCGWIAIRGRLIPMLEVGTGFHPDLSGRENVHLNAAIHGLTYAETVARMSDIAAFSGLGDALDQPIRQYSSGMYVRLAFAVAAHLDADVLVVDEVLAVADERFRASALDHLRQGNHHRVLFYVSHDMESVKSLCARSLVLDHGRLVFDGALDEGIACYRSLNHACPPSPS